MAYTRTNARIVNPSSGDNYYDGSGAAYDAKADFSDSLNPGAQPNLNGGVAKNLYSDRTLLNNVAFGIISSIYGSTVIGGNVIGYANWGDAVSITSVASSNSVAVYTLVAHGLAVADVINITDTSSKVVGPQRITIVTDDTFTTTKLYSSGAGTMTYMPSVGTFAKHTADEWIMRRYTTTIQGGQAMTVLLSGASDFGRRRTTHRLVHLYTRRVATAIRAGYWNISTGTWSTDPTVNDDASTYNWGGTNDTAASPTYAIPGKLVYKEPKPLPNSANYPTQV